MPHYSIRASTDYIVTSDDSITTLLGLIAFTCKDWMEKSVRIPLQEIWKLPKVLIYDWTFSFRWYSYFIQSAIF